MKVQIIFFSDSHLGFDDPIRPKLTIRRRGIDFFNNFKFVLQYATTKKVDFVVHGGDLFFRSKVHGLIIDKTYNALISFVQTGIPIYIVPGNHERSQLPQSLLIQHPHIHIFSQPKSFYQNFGKTRISLSGFPFERSNVKRKFQDLVKQTGWNNLRSDIKILCLHQVIEGAKVGPSGYTFKSGDDIIPLSHIPTDATIILAGHIHRQQELYTQGQLNSNPVPILFSGSVERTSFAEKDEVKGFYHLTFTRQTHGRWELSGKNFIQLNTRPMIDIRLSGGMTCDQNKDFILKQINNHHDAIIRIKLKDAKIFNQYRHINSQWLREILPNSVSFVFSKNFDKTKF